MWTKLIRGTPEIVYAAACRGVMDPNFTCKYGMPLHQLHPLFAIPPELRTIFYALGGIRFAQVGLDPDGTSRFVPDPCSVPIARGRYAGVITKKELYVHRPIHEVTSAPNLRLPTPDQMLRALERPTVVFRREPQLDSLHRQLIGYVATGRGVIGWKLTISGRGIYLGTSLRTDEETVTLALRRLRGYAYQQGWDFEIPATRIL